MAAYGWTGPLRATLRRTALQLFQQLAESDDGRRVLRGALAGVTVPGAYPGLPAALPYAELAPAAPAGRNARPPIFITGRFRSGSTLLWNLFRQVPTCRSYYEPLNERRWFDGETRGTRVDRTHVRVEDYWQEYEGLRHLGQWYQTHWIDRRLYMSATDWDPNLHAYISELVRAAPVQAALQFNRVDFRLPWLRAHFQAARVIHLFRHPRDQWCSSLVTPNAFPASGTMAQFRKNDHFCRATVILTPLRH